MAKVLICSQCNTEFWGDLSKNSLCGCGQDLGKNRYLELDYQHKKNIDRLINQIASHQGTYALDKAIMIALHDTMEKIYNNCRGKN
tara:strand:- start:9 stop:266 length:258 start_codon:yes stop_codon:yes gene_type:complete